MKFTLCKKQYLYLALAVISMVLAVATHAFAEESPANFPPPDGPIPVVDDMGSIQAQTPKAREVRREERADQIKGQRTMLEAKMQERLINLARNVIGKMESATNRMDQIITRIDARIIILKGKGVDTSKAEAVLGNAKDSLATGKSMLTALDPSTVSAMTSEKPRDAFKTTKSQFMVTRATLRDTHEYLKEVVVLLKEAVKARELPSGASDAVHNEESLKTASSTVEN